MRATNTMLFGLSDAAVGRISCYCSSSCQTQETFFKRKKAEAAYLLAR